MKIKQKILLALIALSSITLAQDDRTYISSETKGYTSSTGITQAYYSYQYVDGEAYNRIALVTDKDFHTCSTTNKNWGELREVDLGAKRYNALSSVILAALLADKTVSLNISDTECYGSRAKILSLRINK